MEKYRIVQQINTITEKVGRYEVGTSRIEILYKVETWFKDSWATYLVFGDFQDARLYIISKTQEPKVLYETGD